MTLSNRECAAKRRPTELATERVQMTASMQSALTSAMQSFGHEDICHAARIRADASAAQQEVASTYLVLHCNDRLLASS